METLRLHDLPNKPDDFSVGVFTYLLTPVCVCVCVCVCVFKISLWGVVYWSRSRWLCTPRWTCWCSGTGRYRIVLERRHSRWKPLVCWHFLKRKTADVWEVASCDATVLTHRCVLKWLLSALIGTGMNTTPTKKKSLMWSSVVWFCSNFQARFLPRILPLAWAEYFPQYAGLIKWHFARNGQNLQVIQNLRGQHNHWHLGTTVCSFL